MGLLSSANIMYGPPVPQPLYGMPFNSPITTTVSAILSIISSPVVVILSFAIGTILYLKTQKKVFVIVPLILTVLYLIRYLLRIN